MAIQGLTTQRTYLPPVIGKLRKGSEGKAAKTKNGKDYKTYGDDLNHFRFTPRLESEVQLLQDFASAYGDAPQRIEVYLPSDDVNVVFDAWREEWSASQLLHRCDGEVIYERNRTTGEYEPTRVPCPWLTKERTVQNPGCKQIGRLAVLLPELVNAGHYGIVTVETHSLNDIANIHRVLSDFKERFGRLTGVPFYVYRYAEKISTPSNDGKRARREKWLVGITPATEFVQRQLEVARQRALSGGAIAALPAPRADSDGVVIEGESQQVKMMTRDQWENIAAMAREVYGDSWSGDLANTIETLTDGRTRKPKDLTHAEARQLFDALEDEESHYADLDGEMSDAEPQPAALVVGNTYDPMEMAV